MDRATRDENQFRFFRRCGASPEIVLLGALAALSGASACGDDIAMAESETGALSADADGWSGASGDTTSSSASSAGTTGSSSTGVATTSVSGSTGGGSSTGDACGASDTLEVISPGAVSTNPVLLAVEAGPSVVRVSYTAEGIFPLGESVDAGSDFAVEVTLMTLGPRTIEATAYDSCDEVVATASVVTVVSDDDGMEDPGELGDPVCYPGASGSWDACFDLVIAAEHYDYPPALDQDPNYRAPKAFLDVGGLDLGVYVAPNFQLSELIKPAYGDYVVIQPHALARLQELRDKLGAIQVTSGYRNPEHNASVGGATWSRHMYGDGFDLYPSESDLESLFAECAAKGASFRQLYDNHVHCDWRAETVDTRFFGDAKDAAPAQPNPPSVELVADGDGFLAPAIGWDEGEPLRRWRALDAQGDRVAEAYGARFVPPAGSSTVEVEVGGVLRRTIAVD